MVFVIPMIRAAAAMPLVRWLQARGRPVRSLLKEVDLTSLPHLEPLHPIPLLSAFALLQKAGQIEGPDVSCRMVSETSALELLLLGKVALGARTPREAMMRISLGIPFFCTHEHLAIDPRPDGVVLREFFAVSLPPDTLHLVHQYVAEMTRTLCRMSGAKDPVLTRIEMAPHPEFGLDHLRRWFGDSVAPTKLRTLSVFLDSGVVDAPFSTPARDRMARGLPPDLTPLRGDGTFSGSARSLIKERLSGGEPSLESVSALAGMSVRTFQRRLDAEGVSFSVLVDEVRRSIALERLSSGTASVAALSAELGYARQASLTRAVRRWTGRTPQQLRSAVRRPGEIELQS